jgi:exoribonuclease II
MTSRHELRGIARRAITAHGLLPDFSLAVLAETNAMEKAVAETGPHVRDLRDLLWASIDNDDSRDLLPVDTRVFVRRASEREPPRGKL